MVRFPIMAHARHRMRPWLGRALLAIGLPAALLLALEAGLRMAGVGVPAGFVLPGRDDTLRDNPEFGRAFFASPEQARTPWPFRVNDPKTDRTVRIVVLGGSAAMGDPEPAFGLGRQLEILLNAGAGDRRFEVINAAFVAVNSHVMRQVAEDTVRLQPDVYVLYMGHNEVVGPFGPGTVFQSFIPPSPAVVQRMIDLRRLRTGQGARQAMATLGLVPGDRRALWRGMEMFLDRPLPPGDEALLSVASMFEDNLRAIVRTARKAGAATLLVVPPANIQDCAPFGPWHGPGGDPAQSRARQADRRTEQGDLEGALALLEAALAQHPDQAGLWFRKGRVLQELHQPEAAHPAFVRARDCDTFRFRIDSRLQEIILRTARGRAAPEARTVCLDARRRPRSPAGTGLSGDAFFLDHVHPTFSGTYALARGMAEPLLDLLQLPPRASWLPEAEVRERLAFNSWEALRLSHKMLRRRQRPPFTRQMDHEQDIERLSQTIRELTARTRNRAPALAGTYHRALFADPPDWVLQRNLARFHNEYRRDPINALPPARAAADLMPHVPPLAATAARLEARTGHPEAAARRLKAFPVLTLADAAKTLLDEGHAEAARALPASSADDARETRRLRADADAALGHRDRAARELEALLKDDPDHAPTALSLALIRAEQNRWQDALTLLETILARDPTHTDARYNLALCQYALGEHRAATDRLQTLAAEAPNDSRTHETLARWLREAGQLERAFPHATRCARLEPDDVNLLFFHATLAQQLDHLGTAVQTYEHILTLQSNHVAALNNLAGALLATSSSDPASTARALTLAQRAVRHTHGKDPVALDTLSAAQYHHGDPCSAEKTARKALKQARRQGQEALAAQIQTWLTHTLENACPGPSAGASNFPEK